MVLFTLALYKKGNRYSLLDTWSYEIGTVYAVNTDMSDRLIRRLETATRSAGLCNGRDNR